MMASGCASIGDKSAVVQRRVELPPGIAATITASALRTALRAEPVAAAAGAPATRQPDGSFVIAFTQDRSGHWLPLARHRLHVRCDAPGAAATVEVRSLSQQQQLGGFGVEAKAQIRIDVSPAPGGAMLSVEAPRRDLPRVLELLDRTLALATSAATNGTGLRQPDLEAWRSAQLLAQGRALAATSPDRQHDLLRQAARLGAAPCVVDAWLAEVASQLGDHIGAASGYRRALLSTRDPVARAALAARAEAASRLATQPTSLRSTAVDRLLAGQLVAAETLMHSARRATPSPAIDYQLLGHLHRQRGDGVAALAAELLADECEPHANTGVAGLASSSWLQTMSIWSRRLALGVAPLFASHAPTATPAK